MRFCCPVLKALKQAKHAAPVHEAPLSAYEAPAPVYAAAVAPAPVYEAPVAAAPVYEVPVAVAPVAVPTYGVPPPAVEAPIASGYGKK